MPKIRNDRQLEASSQSAIPENILSLRNRYKKVNKHR